MLHPLKSTKAFSRETRFPIFGTSDKTFVKCCTPLKLQNIFPENKNPRFWDIHASISDILVHIFAFWVFYIFFQSKSMRACMVSRMMLRKSSAIYLVPRVFAQKGFAMLVFGHLFLSISENFFDFCAK